MSSDLVTLIEKSQRELAGMRAFHQSYLDRRKAQRIHTGTDEIMEQHQAQIPVILRAVAGGWEGLRWYMPPETQPE